MQGFVHEGFDFIESKIKVEAGFIIYIFKGIVFGIEFEKIFEIINIARHAIIFDKNVQIFHIHLYIGQKK